MSGGNPETAKRQQGELARTVAYCDAPGAMSASIAGAMTPGLASAAMGPSLSIPIDVVEEVAAELPESLKAVDPSALQQALGEFRLVRPLGEGAMGTVYLAEHRVIGSQVAIKFLKPTFAENPEVVEQFHDEARAVNRIGHPGIVRIFDLKFVPPSCYMLVMEHVHGRPLSSLCGQPMPAKVAVPILAQICDALDAAHRVGVVHRDVKPDNVFVLPGDRKKSVKLLDFGAVRLQEEAARKETDAPRKLVLGTPAFMPLEQWKNEGIDGRTDVFAVGVIAYLLTTGRRPFGKKGASLKELFVAHRDSTPEAPRALHPHVPDVLSELIMKAIARRPEDRFQSAAEMAAALRKVLSRKSERTRRGRMAAPEVSLTPTYVTMGTQPVQMPADEASQGLTLDGGVWANAFRACASATSLGGFVPELEL